MLFHSLGIWCWPYGLNALTCFWSCRTLTRVDIHSPTLSGYCVTRFNSNGRISRRGRSSPRSPLDSAGSSSSSFSGCQDLALYEYLDAGCQWDKTAWVCDKHQLPSQHEHRRENIADSTVAWVCDRHYNQLISRNHRWSRRGSPYADCLRGSRRGSSYADR